MTIDFQDIFERCMMESAYIGRRAAEADSDAARANSDERIFSNQYVGKFRQLRIRQSDRTLLMTFIREGAHLIENRLSALLQRQGEYSGETVSWVFSGSDETIETSEASSRQGLYGLTEDLLTAYALWRWLCDKLPDQSAVYATKWSDGIMILKQSIRDNRLRKPKKRKEADANLS